MHISFFPHFEYTNRRSYDIPSRGINWIVDWYNSWIHKLEHFWAVYRECVNRNLGDLYVNTIILTIHTSYYLVYTYSMLQSLELVLTSLVYFVWPITLKQWKTVLYFLSFEKSWCVVYFVKRTGAPHAVSLSKSIFRC